MKIKSILLLLLLLCVGSVFAEKPNIIIIMTDDSGFSDLGCYGSEISTPHLDTLASKGMRFANFYNNGRCSPTRASLLTGQHSGEVGFAAGTLGGYEYERNIPAYRARLPYDIPTLPELLKTANYTALMVGKWHLGGSDLRNKPAAQDYWKNKHPGWELTDVEIETEFNAMPFQRGFDKYFGTLGGETHQFVSPDDPNRYLEGNQRADLPFTKTYNMYCHYEEEGKYPFTENHGKTEKAFYSTDGETDRAIEMIEAERDSEDPFFLYLAYRAPHLPVQAPAELVDKYMNKYDNFTSVEQERVNNAIKKGVFTGTDYLPNYDKTGSISNSMKNTLKTRFAVHAAMVENIDENIGKLIAALKREGKLDNTLIFYFSDNGAATHVGDMMNTPYRGAKALLWEGGVKTHAIAYWDGVISPNSISDTYVWVGDMVPTCMEVAQADYPETFRGRNTTALDGRSILPALRGENMTPPEYIFSNDKGQQGLIYQGQWKLLIEPGWYLNTSTLPGTAYELYDIQADPAETNNLSGVNSNLVKDLEELAEEWQEECGIIEYGTLLQIDPSENPFDQDPEHIIVHFTASDGSDSTIVHTISEIDSVVFYPSPVSYPPLGSYIPPTTPAIDESDYTVYYVNSEMGDDNNSGLSEDAPIKTLSKAAVIARNPNTKILFKSGQVFKGLLWLGSLQSTETKPLIIDSYGGDERPTVDGEGSANGAAVTLSDDNVRIRNIRVTNKEGKRGIWVNPVAAGAFKNIEITGCRIEEVNWAGDNALPDNPKSLNVEEICPDNRYVYQNAGICFEAKTKADVGASWFENIYVTNNEIHKVSRTGIWMGTFWGKRPGIGWGFNTYINDNEGWYPAENVVVQGNDISYTGGDAVVLLATRNSFLDSNKAYHANYLGREGFANAGIWPHSSINCTMQYNEVAYTHKEHGAGDGEGLDVDIACVNTIVQFNYVHHNAGGGLLICNNKSDGQIGNHRGTIVRNNIFYDNGENSEQGALITVSSGVKNVSVHNNLVVASDRLSNVKFVRSADWAQIGMNDNFTFRNNIFIGTSPISGRFDLAYILNCKFENNLYYQIGSQTALGDRLLLDYNPLVNIPDVFDGYENGLNFKPQETKVFVDGLLFDGMSREDIEGNNAEGAKYLGPFLK